MLQRLRSLQDEREGGFTLIELLVVILIIAILAAIAIPFFLNQRERGYRSQMQSSLKNAATAMETVAVDNDGDYSSVNGGTADADLASVGYRPTDAVTVDIVSSTTDYCLTATHTSLPSETWYYDSASGKPDTTAC